MKNRHPSILRTCIGLGLAILGLTSLHAAVPAQDITLQPVLSDNLPIFTSLTAYNYVDSNVLPTATDPYDSPLYYPFDTTTTAWWDNLVADQLSARLSVVMFATRGVVGAAPGTTITATTPALGNNLDPRRLSMEMDALQRAGATNLLKIACFVDTPSMQGIYTAYYGVANTTKMDLSSQDAWNQILWLRTVKPWFDTVPATSWYEIGGRPVIQFWGINTATFANAQGNMSQMLQFLSDTFNSTYGLRPVFIVDQNWPKNDTTCLSQPDIIGVNSWFGPPSTPNTFTTLGNFVSGCAVAGFINPNYYNSSSTGYHQASEIVVRTGTTGANGATLQEGLENAYTDQADFTVLEGFNDVREWAGLYRANSSPYWDYPSQYINIVRNYTDLNTITLRLEAEAADSYGGTTGTVTTPVYRRSGNLACRTLPGSGWAVTNTAANEWIQFNGVYLSPGNYKFPIRYSATAGHSMRLYVDGVALPDVALPATADSNTFDTISLGSKYIGWGTHTLRVQFLQGGVDLDWLFVKKSDTLLSLRSISSGGYMTAELGGFATVTANRSAIGSWERFTADDSTHPALTSGDLIYLQAKDGMLFSAAAGGGGALTVDRRRAGSYEQFTITKVSGSGAIANGDIVTLRSTNGHYLTVGANTDVDVTSSTVGPSQEFTVTLTAQ